MKGLLLVGLLLAGLSSCSKKEDDAKPATPSLVGTWVKVTSSFVTTNKTTGAVTNQFVTLVPNTVTLTFTTDGKVTSVSDKSVTPVGVTVTATGTYSYSGNTLTSIYNGQTSTQRVDVLTTNKMTLVSGSEDSNNRYVATDDYTR